MGSNNVRKKAGTTDEEALRNAVRIEAEVLKQWDEEANPFAAAQATSQTQDIPHDQALEEELRDQGYRLAERDRIVSSLYDEEELARTPLALVPTMKLQTRFMSTLIPSCIDAPKTGAFLNC